MNPIRSLDAFGMHLIEDNPGVKEALSAREHSMAIQQRVAEPGAGEQSTAADESETSSEIAEAPAQPQSTSEQATTGTHTRSTDEESNWPYGQADRKSSKEAWWRTLGRGRKRDTEGE